MRLFLSRIWLLALLLTACQSRSTPPAGNLVSPPVPDTASEPNPASATARPTILSPTPGPAQSLDSPTASAESSVLAAPQPTATRIPLPEICSPLADIPLGQLPSLIANPYNPPRPGSDDPHQGVDLADVDPVTRISLEGRAVQAALSGIVAGVVVDRFPYGNAVLIETPLDQIPIVWQDSLELPTPAPTTDTHPVLTCPTPQTAPTWDLTRQSLYVMYAHLQSPPAVQPGDRIACETTIGQIGTTGNALNPHVHLEMRIGPAGARIDSLAHYTADASLEEMRSYCQWRVSQIFQLVDPMLLFKIQP